MPVFFSREKVTYKPNVEWENHPASTKRSQELLSEEKEKNFSLTIQDSPTTHALTKPPSSRFHRIHII